MGKFHSLAEGVSFRCQWGAVLAFGKHYNWIDFDFIHAYVEYDKISCNMEIDLALLGLGVNMNWHIGHSEQSDELNRRMRLVEAGIMETVPVGEMADGTKVVAAAPLANEFNADSQ